MQDLEKKYNDWCENDAPMAPDEVVKARDTFYESIENYIIAIEEHYWKCGFMHAMKLSGKEVP